MHHSWSADTGKENIYAARDIDKDEEILTSYFECWATRSDRQRQIRQRFHFDCGCSACSGPPDAASDARRVKIDRLGDMIPRTAPSDPIGTFRLAKERLRLMEEEGISYPIESAKTLDDAFQTCVGISDFAAAKRCIGLAYAFTVLSEGPASTTTERYRILYNCPSAHPASGMLRSRVMPTLCDACGSDVKAFDAHGRDVPGSRKGIISKQGSSKDRRRLRGETDTTEWMAGHAAEVCVKCASAVYCSGKCQSEHLKWHQPSCDVLDRAYGRRGTELLLL